MKRRTKSCGSGREGAGEWWLACDLNQSSGSATPASAAANAANLAHRKSFAADNHALFALACRSGGVPMHVCGALLAITTTTTQWTDIATHKISVEEGKEKEEAEEKKQKTSGG